MIFTKNEKDLISSTKVVNGAGLIVSRINDGFIEFLMGFRSDNGQLAFPVGHVNKEEDCAAAAVRSFKKETGYELPKNAKDGICYVGTSIFTYKGHLNRSYLYVLEETDSRPLSFVHEPDRKLTNVRYYNLFDIAKLLVLDKVFPPSLINLNLIINYILNIDPYLLPRDLSILLDY